MKESFNSIPKPTQNECLMSELKNTMIMSKLPENHIPEFIRLDLGDQLTIPKIGLSNANENFHEIELTLGFIGVEINIGKKEIENLKPLKEVDDINPLYKDDPEIMELLSNDYIFFSESIFIFTLFRETF